ncbi:hypothetical protein [Butyricicoccus pullicaecorum]|nr:hypothetical protein [Butyricicoccus pullicaecorum]
MQEKIHFLPAGQAKNAGNPEKLAPLILPSAGKRPDDLCRIMR